MARVDNLDQDLTRSLIRRIEALERATPGNRMSIGRNGLRVYDGGHITIENNGGITITGPDGELVGSGTINWTGTMNNTGPVNLKGDTSITGTLDVSGLVTLLNSLILEGGGKIDIGGVEMSGGVISGTTVQINGTSVILLVGATQVLGTLLVSQLATLSSLAVQNNASIGGTLTYPGVSGIALTGHAPNLYIDSAGKIWKTQ